VILPGCPKAEKRNPPFQSSSRARLRQRPPGNRWRHNPIARNTDQAILGDQNGRETFWLLKLRIFYLTGEVLRAVLLECFLCEHDTNSAAPIVASFLPANDLFHAVRWFVLRLLYLLVDRWILSPLLVTHSILCVLYSSTFLHSNILTVCGNVCCINRYPSPNKVQCVFVQGALCQGKTQQNVSEQATTQVHNRSDVNTTITFPDETRAVTSGLHEKHIDCRIDNPKTKHER